MAPRSLIADRDVSQQLIRQFTQLDHLDAATDFEIICSGNRWGVHKFVLRLHSPVLARVCDGTFSESENEQIDLSDHDPACIDTLMLFLYKLDYDLRHLPSNAHAPLTLHTKMCVIADKYDIQTLQTLARKKFTEQLESKKTTDVDDLTEAAGIAYDALQPTDAIRAAIAKKAADSELIFKTFDEPENTFERLTRSTPDLAIDIVQAVLSEKYGEENRYDCPHCKATIVIRTSGIVSPTSRVSVNCRSCRGEVTVLFE